jgi:hypothetical protein
MKSNFEFEEYDCLTEDPADNQFYYTKDGKIHKFNQNNINSNKIELESIELTEKNKSNTINNNESIKFSTINSGKNIIIHGGGK